MEHIVRERIYPEAASPVPKLRLSPLLLILFITVAGFAMAILGTRAVARYGQALADPFPVYADIFPGQSASAIESRPFSCNKDYGYYLYGEIYCRFMPPAGIFSRVDVVISGDTILRLTFMLRDNTLHVGDLARVLETATMHRFNRTVYFLLPTTIIRADTAVRGREYSLFLPVWSITFMKLS